MKKIIMILCLLFLYFALGVALMLVCLAVFYIPHSLVDFSHPVFVTSIVVIPVFSAAIVYLHIRLLKAKNIAV